MADEEDLLVQVEGEGQTDNEGEAQEDPVELLKQQFEAQKAENKKLADARDASNRRAADERARAEAAERRATEAQGTIADTQLDGVVSAIAAATAEAEAAEKDYAAAAEAGDFKKQAEAQRRMARAESRATSLEGAKADLELRKSIPRTEDPNARRTADPFEEHVSKFTERTAQWMREHRDWIVDPAKGSELAGAHHRAVREGLKPDTDDYFEFVEKMIGLRQDEQQPHTRNGAGNGQQQQTRVPARRVTPAVAPVNGGAGGHSSGAGDRADRNTVRLTKGEAEAANKTIVWNYDDPTGKGRFKKGDPIGNQEYARRKLEMQKGGYYDRSYTES